MRRKWRNSVVQQVIGGILMVSLLLSILWINLEFALWKELLNIFSLPMSLFQNLSMGSEYWMLDAVVEYFQRWVRWLFWTILDIGKIIEEAW